MYTSLWLRGRESEFNGFKSLPINEAWDKMPASDEGPWLDNLYLDSIKYNDREKYGRILGYIYRDNEGMSLNDRLVESGLGV